MKKIFIAFIFLPIAFTGYAQLSGDGSFSNPYYGTLNQDITWNSDVYIGGDIITSAYKLSISAGVKVIFVTSSTNIVISGTGQLDAEGTSGNPVRFTADFNNNGVYGESGERWGHISLNGSGTCSLTYCIIEYGEKTGALDEGYGGGIYINNQNVTLSSCVVRNNYALWGGGIMIDQSKGPLIENCLIYSNTSEKGGGGVEMDPNANPILNNCIFRNNANLGSTYGGGGICLWQSGTSKISNCTIVDNTSTGSDGDNVYFFGSTYGNFINSIIWGSENSVYYNGTYYASHFVNSAIQRIYNAGGTLAITYFTNCIDLASSNTAIDGPNFVDPATSDYSIKFISPCRDAGTTPSPTVPNDYIGNPRIGPYDIGAYEVQYSRWLTNASTPTSWSSGSNWEQGFYPGYTGTTGDVVIPSLASAYAPNISGTTTIASGKYLILEAGAKATLGTITNNGTLKLESDATTVSSLITNSFSGSDATIELYLTGGASPDYKWHYISSPVTSLSTDVFTSQTDNLAQYVSNRPSTDPLQGWVAYDGYVYFGGGSDPTNAFSNLSVGKGYNYYHTADYKYTFSGQLNTGTVNMPMAYTTGNDALYGFNLLGNPFSSGLDWDQIIIDGSFPANTSKGVYFTRDNAQCSYIGGVGNPSGVTGIIPPMQGFFTKTYGTGNSINLLASARVQDNIHDRYKGATIIPLVRLSITENSKSDETVVRFDEQAKSYLDNDFDALKMFISASNTSIYSSLGGIKYSINGQPFPETFVEIPIVVNLLTSGNHSISTTQLQGLDSYKVSLIDNTTGFTANLKTTPVVTFFASAGLITDRFILKVTNATTGIEDPVVSKNIFNIYQGNDLINIQTIADEWDGKTGSVSVFDLTGRTVSDNQNSEFWKNSLIQIPSPVTKGLYIVEIKSGVKRYAGKVVIR